MAIRESLLNTINSIATSDFVRAVTSAGASSKVTVSNLAKAIVENYTGSTLAGSAQSVKDAIDTLNSKQPHMTAGETVTFPFAPTYDGFVTVKASVPANATSYAIFYDSGNNFVGSGFTTGGVSWATTFPVLQGRTYTLSASSNATLTYTYQRLYL